jgi:hypothetical protein
MPETLDELNGQNPALAETQLEEAHKHFRAGAFENSLRCVRAAMILTTVDRHAIRSYVLALQDADRHELAAEFCEHALAQYPDDDLF